MLTLEDLRDMTEEEVKKHLECSYEASREEIDKFEILIAYESVGNWGCESSSFFLLREKSTGKLYENHGSHCSCYGFEDQFYPEETSVGYLKSEHFIFYSGGYDGDEEENRAMVLEYINGL